jgi:hypothetical protein
VHNFTESGHRHGQAAAADLAYAMPHTRRLQVRICSPVSNSIHTYKHICTSRFVLDFSAFYSRNDMLPRRLPCPHRVLTFPYRLRPGTRAQTSAPSVSSPVVFVSFRVLTVASVSSPCPHAPSAAFVSSRLAPLSSAPGDSDPPCAGRAGRLEGVMTPTIPTDSHRPATLVPRSATVCAQGAPGAAPFCYLDDTLPI